MNNQNMMQSGAMPPNAMQPSAMPPNPALPTSWTVEGLRNVTFKPEELYTLIGGPDYARYVIPGGLISLGAVVQDWQRQEMLRDLIDAFSFTRVVDMQGRPCPALAELLEPIRESMFDLADGAPSYEGDEADPRTFCAYFGRRYATMIRRMTLGEETVFTLTSLGTPNQWEQRFMTETGIGPWFRYAASPMRITLPNNDVSRMLSNAMAGDQESAQSFASAMGLDATPFVTMAVNSAQYNSAVSLTNTKAPAVMYSLDYRYTRHTTPDRLRVDARVGPQRMRLSQIAPCAGGFTHRDTTPNPDPNLSVWDAKATLNTQQTIFEFVTGGSPLAMLTGVPANEWGIDPMQQPGAIGGPTQPAIPPAPLPPRQSQQSQSQTSTNEA